MRYGIYSSDVFRTPSQAEKTLGLWVDRIGSRKDSDEKPGKLRRLKLYAAVFVEKGSGILISEGVAPLQIKAGETMLLFPDVGTMYYPDSRWSTKWIVWNGKDAENIERLGLFSPANPVIPDISGSVARIYGALSGLMGREDALSIVERKNLVLGMLIELYRNSRTLDRPDPFQEKAENIIARIRSAPQDDYDIPGLARDCGLSASHFRRLFRKFTGRSPVEFILASRISKAKEMISAGTPIKEAASALGYADIFYFMRVFRKIAGITPGEFKNSQGSPRNPGKRPI